MPHPKKVRKDKENQETPLEKIEMERRLRN